MNSPPPPTPHSLGQVGVAALSLGMIFVGTCNEEVGSVIVQRLMESSDAELEHPMARLVSLGLGLLFIGKNEKADAMMEVRYRRAPYNLIF